MELRYSLAEDLPSCDPLFAPDVVQGPFDYYRQLRETDPVHEVVPGTFVVTRMDLIHDVVNRPGIYSSTAWGFLHKGEWSAPGLRPLLSGADPGNDDIPGLIATADPPDHERHRKVLSRKFTTGAIRDMEPGFRELVVGALAKSDRNGRLEWMGEVAEPLPMIMVGRILGLADTEVATLRQLGFGLVDRISGFASEERIRQLDDEGITGIAPVVDAYMAARRGSATYGDGIITVLANAVADNDLDDVEAIGILTVLIAAGGESTTSLLGTAVHLLATRPDLQDRLRRDPALIATFVEEALRFDPPFRGHYRIVKEDTMLGGTPILAGSHVVLMWPAANRDERIFEEPDEVRLDRANPRYHLGFGWGIHLCIGAPLARLEARVAIEELLASTRRFRVDTGAETPRYRPSLLVRRLDSLPLVLDTQS